MQSDHARECALEISKWWCALTGHMIPTKEPQAIIARHIAAAVESETAELRALLTMFVPTTPCSLDHNGNCQEHGWFHLDADNPCPVVEAQKLLGKSKP